MTLYNNKILTKQQWDSLPLFKKYHMKYRTPDFYNYYQKRYGSKAEPVAQKRTIEAEDGMLGSIATTPSQEETPAPVSRTISGPPTDEQRALAYRLFAQNNDRRMLNEIIEYDKEAAYIKETSAANESVSKSPYEDGSASASFYGNQSFADIGATADSDNWWDVADPKAFFGVQGDRNATQQANTDRFINEWEEVSDNSRTSRSTLNGLIDGTYDASLVADNWGSNTSLSGLEQVRSYSDTIGEYGGDFGAYLRQEWDNFNTSQGVDLGGLNTSPTIGTVASDGPSGRASIETPERLSMQSYVDAISSAAQEAGTPLKVALPDGSMYELNYGQFDNVPLGAYNQTQDADSTLDKVARVTGQIFSSVIQGILTGAVSGALFTGLSKIPKVGKALETLGGVYQNGVLEFFPEAQAALQAGIEQGESITTIMGSYLGFGINSVVTNNIRDQLGLSEDPEAIITNEDAA